MHDKLNDEVEDDAAHDFDIIRHDDRCNYKDDGKGLRVDVDEILDATKSEIGDSFKATVEEIEDVVRTIKEKASPEERVVLEREFPNDVTLPFQSPNPRL